jgi:hypothetical protein
MARTASATDTGDSSYPVERTMRMFKTVGLKVSPFPLVAGLLIVVAGGMIGMVALFGSVSADVTNDLDAKLRVPDGYRTAYQYLGTWAAAAEDAPGSQELHVVYAAPGTIEAYRRDGGFPDGTILVKEVYRAATEEMTTGTISHAGTLRGWFVMVRDAKGRHAESPLWGDGWGWSWFDAADPVTPSRALPVADGSVAATLDFRENCKPCHAPAEATAWIYVQGYPALKN